MINSGESAPSFTLSGVRDGTIEEIVLDTILGESVVILAFYPGDFNPACSGSETGLDELDLFTMQKDVTVLALSGDSVYSHQAFADQYNLHMPLLSDTDGSVADRYGVAAEEGAGYLTQRAVVVIDHAGTVQFTWQSDKPRSVPTAERIRAAVQGIGDDETAESRYRVGHAHYIEGRRGFTSAMKAYEDREWMMAQTDFTQAAGEFDEAGDEFNTAARFAEDGGSRTHFERAEDKAEALWRAADWLSDSASAFASGEGARGESLRDDAEAPLETARDLDEPPEPDDFPPTGQVSEDEEPSHPLAETEQPDTSLDTDVGASETDELELSGESPTAEKSERSSQADETNPATDGPTESQKNAEMKGQSPSGTSPTEDRSGEQTESAEESAEEIDDAELEEITAELEEQTEAADHSEPEPAGENIVPDNIEMDEEQENGAEGGEVELDLSDPGAEDGSEKSDGEKSETADEEESGSTDGENMSGGDHGVPDSL